eukprot:CAMPEP_0117758706 /NCGR_PEP_ID=MMETSP0947-20121206/15559_1 /TAXON_ID=44440 /ORGANISM="Chattonella subsalsa, Strain CCMP2191" /LENGTH=554 /DNA_ID=CAMNT_0005578987 /DNA_START=151 /DNA_END=1815 /DNA_ORIENTATION=-
MQAFVGSPTIMLNARINRSLYTGRTLSFIHNDENNLADKKTSRGAMRMHHGTADLTFNEGPTFSVGPSDASVVSFSGDLLILPFYQVESEDKEARVSLEGAVKELDEKLDGAIAELVDLNEFQGKPGSSAIARMSKGFKVAIVGMGKKAEKKVGAFEKLGNFVATTSETEKAKVVGLAPSEDATSEEIQAALEAFYVGLYKDKRFKDTKEDKPLPLKSLDLLGCSDAKVCSRAEKIASGINYTKDLVNAPANYVTPTSLAESAVEVAKEFGLEYEIFDQEKIEEMKMGAYLGVAQGAIEPPKFIHLTYKPSGETKKKVALIGKGLTFDSGGYNIKAGAGSMIEMMKFDMGGSAATLGAAKAIAQLKPENVEVHFIVAACENMVSDRAMRPGDILTASNGKTIEVLNTDAEGRLTLADALVFAENLGVDAIVDSATLTGACIVALGPQYAGMWSSDEELAKELKDSAEATGEKLWQLPLAPEYAEDIKSKFADLKNIGGKGGGSITAALFLKEFVKDTPWAHIDLAGPVWSDKLGGATGYGVRTLTNWVEKQSSK